jgi:CHASE2 domain-containing sensor protein
MPLPSRIQLVFSRCFRPVRGAVSGILCALVAWSLAQVPMMHGLDDWLLDGSFVLRGGRATSARVLLINIDDASLDQLKKPAVFLSPKLAEVVKHLHNQGASAIGIDVMIPESYTRLPALQAGGEGDATTMGTAIEQSGAVVLPEWQLEGRSLRPLLQWQLKALTDPDPHGTDFGLVNLTEDGDQFVRRQQLAVRTGKESVSYQFALALISKAQQTPVSWDPERGQLSLGRETVPLDAAQMMRINFVGPPGTVPTTSPGRAARMSTTPRTAIVTPTIFTARVAD